MAIEFAPVPQKGDFNLNESEQITALKQQMDSWAHITVNFGNVDSYLQRTGMQVIKNNVLPSGLVLVCNSEFPVQDEPKRHDYSHLFTGNTEQDEGKISHARHYVDEHEYKGHKLWIHDLDGHTSHHTHDKYELTRVLYGKVVVNGKVISAGQTHIASPETYHQAYSITEPAFILCTLMNGAGEKKDDVHQFE